MVTGTSEYYPVKAGQSGTKIHAGIVVREYSKIIAGKARYFQEFRHICSSGNSSHFHNFHKTYASLIPGATLADVNCSHCLKILESKGIEL